MNDFLYSVEREFDIPVEVLWDAWIDQGALQSWYHPLDLECVPGSVVSEPVEGGAWAVAVDVPDYGLVAHFYGIYTAIAAQARIDHTLHYTESAAEFAVRDLTTPHHLVRVEFDHRGMRSWVKFSQFGDMPESEAVAAQRGMESYFDSLERYLAAGAPSVE
jgi:uncharacterized protein YndB with AHSA1/START domain